MKEFDLDYIDKLKELIEAKDEAQVRVDIQDLHPADIAELINELDDADDALFVLQLLDDETTADVLVELDEDERADLLENRRRGAGWRHRGPAAV